MVIRIDSGDDNLCEVSHGASLGFIGFGFVVIFGQQQVGIGKRERERDSCLITALERRNTCSIYWLQLLYGSSKPPRIYVPVQTRKPISTG